MFQQQTTVCKWFQLRFCWLVHCNTVTRKLFTASLYLFKVKNGKTHPMCETFSKLAINTPEWHHWRGSRIFIFSHCAPVSITTMSKCMSAGLCNILWDHCLYSSYSIINKKAMTSMERVVYILNIWVKTAQLTFTYSKSTTETLKKGMKYVQS